MKNIKCKEYKQGDLGDNCICGEPYMSHIKVNNVEEIKQKTFREFWDELIFKQHNPFGHLNDVELYHEYKQTMILVQDELYKQLKHDKWFHEFKPDIENIIARTVAVTLYIQSLKKEKKP